MKSVGSLPNNAGRRQTGQHFSSVLRTESNTPEMDKVYYLTHRTTVTIDKLVDELNCLFNECKDDEAGFEEEIKEVYGKDA